MPQVAYTVVYPIWGQLNWYHYKLHEYDKDVLHNCLNEIIGQILKNEHYPGIFGKFEIIALLMEVIFFLPTLWFH